MLPKRQKPFTLRILKPVVTLTSISIPLRERTWKDKNPERFRQDCFVVSKAMIRLLRHDQSVPREDDAQYGLITSWKNSRKSSIVLCNGQLMLG